MENKTIEKLNKEIGILEKQLKSSEAIEFAKQIRERMEWKRRQRELLIPYHAR